MIWGSLDLRGFGFVACFGCGLAAFVMIWTLVWWLLGLGAWVLMLVGLPFVLRLG